MFIYHFSKLIKSKLIWGFLIFLIAFAFVFADACSSRGGEAITYYVGEEEVPQEVIDNARFYFSLVDSDRGYFIPMAPLFWDLDARSLSDEEAALRPDLERSERFWKFVAAVVASKDMGFAATDKAAEAYLAKTFVAPIDEKNPDAGYAFSPVRYRNALMQFGFNPDRDERLFRRIFSKAIFPVMNATHAIEYTTGWSSPMEIDFSLSALYDTTEARAIILRDTRDLATITVEDSRINEWYEANKEFHKTPEVRTISYYEVPVTAFMEEAGQSKDLDILALEYFEENRDEFIAEGIKAEDLKYEGDVAAKATEKVQQQIALELAKESLDEQVSKANYAGETAKKNFVDTFATYGEIKTIGLQRDIEPPVLQKAEDVIARVFEMDPTIAPVELCEGDDRLYVVYLDKIDESAIKPLDAVRQIATDACRKDIVEEALTVSANNVRTALVDAIAAGKTIDEAYAACKATLTNLEMTNTVSFKAHTRTAPKDVAYGNTILERSTTLAPQQFSEPEVLDGNAAVIVYVDKRIAGDALAKTTARTNLAIEISRRENFLRPWLTANLEANPAKDGLDNPLVATEEAEEDEVTEE